MQKHSVIAVEQSIREDLAFVDGQFRILAVDARPNSDLVNLRVGTLYGEHRAAADVPSALRDQLQIGTVVCCTGWPEVFDKHEALYLEITDLLPPEQCTLHHCPVAGLPVVGAEAVRKIAELIDTEIRNPAVAQAVHGLLSQPKIFSAFSSKPASVVSHHAEPGGLAQHSLEVAQLVCAIPARYYGEPINRDIAIVAAVIHDLGKIQLYRSADEPYRMHDTSHETRTIGLVGPMIAWLEEHEDISVAEMLMHLLSIDSRAEHASCVAAAAITMADRISATRSSAAIAFADAPSYYRHAVRDLGGGPKKKHIRAVERHRAPPYVSSTAAVADASDATGEEGAMD